jgi:hypothetical protein
MEVSETTEPTFEGGYDALGHAVAMTDLLRVVGTGPELRARA